MKCPKCQSEEIEPARKSAQVEGPLGAAWRHHHANCRKCGETLWWTAPIGTPEAALQAGPHDCAFFRPPAA